MINMPIWKRNKHNLWLKIINKIKNNLINNYKIKIDYFELRNEKDMSSHKRSKKFKIFIAYYIKNVRLIDNF